MFKVNNIYKIFNVDFLDTMYDYFFSCSIKYVNNEKYENFKKYRIKIHQEFINLKLELENN